jgi:hypothetical protein
MDDRPPHQPGAIHTMLTSPLYKKQNMVSPERRDWIEVCPITLTISLLLWVLLALAFEGRLWPFDSHLYNVFLDSTMTTVLM